MNLLCSVLIFNPSRYACRSTANEVALKMAFKFYATQHEIDFSSTAGQALKVIALKNGYHGDTLGTMDCAEASIYNADQTPWYRPRGLFLDPPTCGLEAGTWKVCHSLCMPNMSHA
jgi:dethiobiotin synthetase/adenosylmethionine--8-amino-7-oxononanoate aminotransferase